MPIFTRLQKSPESCSPHDSSLLLARNHRRRFDIRPAGDPLEAEADRAATGLLSSFHPSRPQPQTEGSVNVSSAIHETLAARGDPLTREAREVWEQRFGHDFRRVRIHADPVAAQSARALGAKAYTSGHHIVFANAGHDTAAPESPLLGHELAHVAQQSLVPEAAIIQRQLVTPLAPGGGFRGLMDRDRRRTLQPRNEILNFYHGTRWSSTQRMLTERIEPRGRGDFAAGFYTHFEPSDNERAKQRAKQRGMRAAKEPPAEPYAGVLELQIPARVFTDLLQNNSRIFPLTDRRQPDYAERQREWHQFITTHGRESTPTFKSDQYGERWIYRELRDPASLPYDLIIGPFMQPVPGLPGSPPPPSAFDPKSEGNRLPQQVLWANNGLEVLNARATRRGYQYDADTGNEITPPVPATMAGPPSSTFQTPQNPD
jgi:hypothetical protein